jgi:excisionase family DNA binding protein
MAKAFLRGAAMAEPTANVELMRDGLDRIDEAARFLKVSVSTVYLMLARGHLPSVKIGKCRRIPRRALLELAARGLVPAAAD